MMSKYDPIEAADLSISESWAFSATDAAERSARRAWLVAAVAAAIALLEAVALVWLMPLKETVPYTLLVDRQTGNVEALAPLDAETIAPDAALTRSFLVQYVIARESFDSSSVQDDYRKVALWTAGAERQSYMAAMQATNPQSPLAFMPPGGAIRVEVRSVSSLSAGRSMVRYTAIRTDPGAQPQPPEYYAAIIDYGFSEAAMSEADRLVNPLGFQVTRYRRDMEQLPEVGAAITAANTSGAAASERGARTLPPRPIERAVARPAPASSAP